MTNRSHPIRLVVNGVGYELNVDVRATLLDVLRERLALTGTKKGCDHGLCGACTVDVDRERVLSCLTLAVCADGAEVGTVEGLADGDGLHPLQQAFVDHDGFQCGYCTSGQLCSARAMLREHARGDLSAASFDGAPSAAASAGTGTGTGTDTPLFDSCGGLASGG